MFNEKFTKFSPQLFKFLVKFVLYTKFARKKNSKSQNCSLGFPCKKKKMSIIEKHFFTNCRIPTSFKLNRIEFQYRRVNNCNINIKSTYNIIKRSHFSFKRRL